MSGLVWVYVGRSSSCLVVRWRLGVESFFFFRPLIFPYPWVVLAVGVILFCFPPWHSPLHDFLCCGTRVRSWHEFNVTNAVGAGRDRLDTHGLIWGAAFLAQYQSQALQSPLQHQKERACLIYRMESHHTAAKSTKNGNKNNHRRNHSSVSGSTLVCDAIQVKTRASGGSLRIIQNGWAFKLGRMLYGSPASLF